MITKRYHHIFDLDHCRQIINDPAVIEIFIRDLATAINMTILKGPITAEGIPENPGVSCLAIIDYSHISIHTFTAHNEALIDIFSCKPYDRQVVADLCKSTFATEQSVIGQKEVAWD